MAFIHLPRYGSVPLLEKEEEIESGPLRRKPAPNTSIIARVGYYSCGVLSIGSLVILAAFSYLSFLWWSRGGLWSQIVLNTMVAPSVTLASLAIRTSIGFQAIVCTAMIAALALRWHQVKTAESAAISLFRFANSGPSSLLLPLLGSSEFRVPGAGLLILCLTTITLCSNVISTTLVSDLDVAVIPGYSVENPAFGQHLTNQTYNIPRLNGMNTPLMHRRRADEYPSFAERTLGKPSLMMRHVCVRPQINISNFTQARYDDLYGKKLFGNVFADPDKTGSELFDTTRIDVDCVLHDNEFDVCLLHTNSISESPMLNSTDFGIGAMLNHTHVREIDAQTYLVFMPPDFDGRNTSRDEWLYTNLDAYDIDANETASGFAGYITLCSTLILDKYMHISASRPGNITEPSVHWTDPDDYGRLKFDTEAIRKQLGVYENYTLQERGLLLVESWDRPTTLLDTYFDSLPPESDETENPFHWARDNQLVFINWTFADASVGRGFDNYLFSIANDTLQLTTHPALMFQAIDTIIHSMTYYAEYSAFNLHDPSARIRYFEQALQPVKKRGYWAAAAIIACHFLIMSVISILYISGSGEGDILGQAWVAVTQLKSDEAALIGQNDGTLMDRDVKKLLKENDLANKRVGLVNNNGQGYVIGSLAKEDVRE
ncbi:hypothetical protein DM02DRAFT_698120 [Periconia macrospinosa]|uniref:Uncharacterized protein n=1 Tax=Periconia macrospinosa TaxID=97972 RepID=A0A2V1DYV7_9PLEO|nr:hypothetical protein DM02DRAFT_698120 [Periconia macrospinosa]